MLTKIKKIIDFFTEWLGRFTALLLLVFLINVFYNVMMRYFFKNSSIALQEMEWHLFSIVFLFGIAYTLKENAHVRVDIIYEKLKPKTKAVINIFGAVIFIIPFSLVIINSGYSFAYEAYSMEEISGDPGGLAYRFIIKGSILVSFVFLIFATISFILHHIGVLLEKENQNSHNHSEDIL